MPCAAISAAARPQHWKTVPRSVDLGNWFHYYLFRLAFAFQLALDSFYFPNASRHFAPKALGPLMISGARRDAKFAEEGRDDWTIKPAQAAAERDRTYEVIFFLGRRKRKKKD